MTATTPTTRSQPRIGPDGSRSAGPPVEDRPDPPLVQELRRLSRLAAYGETDAAGRDGREAA